MNKRNIVNIIFALIVIAFVILGGMVGYWLFVAICGILAIQTIASIIKAFHNRRIQAYMPQREFLLKMTARFMGLFFLTGAIIFAFALQIISQNDDPHYSNLEIVIRSCLASIGMFMRDISIAVINKLVVGKEPSHVPYIPYVRGAIVVQTIASFSSTMVLLFLLIYSRVKAYFQLHKHTRVTDERNHLYLFFGLNENVKLLAADIFRCDPKSIVIFIDNANLPENGTGSWGNIMALFTHRKTTFKMADESHALVAVSSVGIAEVEKDKINGERGDLLAMLGIVRVKELICDLAKTSDDPRLNVFFFSEDEDENIRSLINLAKDATILSTAAADKIKHTVYCHARFNGPNRIIEDLAIRKRLNVEIVDSSHLAVELLKSREDCQPVSVVRFKEEHSMLVSEPLNALIVGFGEVGRDAFRYLYEFGTFIDRDSQTREYRVVTPIITAVDKRMSELEGLFRINLPNVEFGPEKSELLPLDCGSYKFYNEQLSPEKCEALNYIVLALGDDDRNIALASAIFNRIRKYRKEMSNLIIMVRCVNEDKLEMMQKIANHYNEGSKEKCNVIRLFGNPSDIYSYRTIIKEELTQKGKSFHESYRQMRGEEETWDERHQRLTGMKDVPSSEIVIPDIDNLRKLRRQESQDMANALHAFTKVYLLQRALGGDDFNITNFSKQLFNGEGIAKRESYGDGKRYYPMLSEEENKVMSQLAVLEHARWNAAHSLLGYRVNKDGNSCNERRMLHNCMVEWKDLDSVSAKSEWQPCDYKAYDYTMVETSIAIVTDKGSL